MRAARSVVKSMTRYITIWKVKLTRPLFAAIWKQVDGITTTYLLSFYVAECILFSASIVSTFRKPSFVVLKKFKRQNMPTVEVLTQKEKELVALAASIAS